MKLLSLLAFLTLFTRCNEDNYGLVYKCDKTELSVPTKIGTEIPNFTLPEVIQERINKYNFNFIKYLEFNCSGKVYILVFENEKSRYSIHLDNEEKVRQESFIRIY